MFIKRFGIFFVLLAFGWGLFFSASPEGNVWAQKGSKPTFQLYETHSIETTLPKSPSRLENRDFWILSVFLVLLLLSTYAALFRRSRRLIVLLSILSIVILGFWFHGCPCPIGSIQHIVLGFFQSNYFVPWTILILFLAPLFMTLFFGRTFCGSTCPIGAVQEMIALFPIKIPNWLEHLLGLFRYFFLGFAVLCVACGLSFIICRFDPIVCLFRGGTGLRNILIFSGLLLVIGVFVGRPYCRFLCPFGALLSICGKLSFQHITVSPGKCDQCRLCENICPYNAILKPTEKPTIQERRWGPIQLGGLLFLMPILILLFGYLGSFLAFPMAQFHPIVKQAELVYAEETGLVDQYGAFDETLAHYRSGVENEALYRNAAKVLRRFQIASPLFGYWVGFIFAAKLISFSVRRKRTEYQTDSGRCFSCGRCFWHCPNQKENRVFLDGQIDFGLSKKSK